MQEVLPSVVSTITATTQSLPKMQVHGMEDYQIAASWSCIPAIAGVYVMLRSEECVYAGQSRNVRQRAFSHRYRFKGLRIAFKEFSEKAARYTEECRVIALLDPTDNKVGGNLLYHPEVIAAAKEFEKNASKVNSDGFREFVCPRPDCSHRWEPRVESPKKCPLCQRPIPTTH